MLVTKKLQKACNDGDGECQKGQMIETNREEKENR